MLPPAEMGAGNAVCAMGRAITESRPQDGSSTEPPANPGGRVVLEFQTILFSPLLTTDGASSPWSLPHLAQAGFVFIKTLLDF